MLGVEKEVNLKSTTDSLKVRHLAHPLILSWGLNLINHSSDSDRQLREKEGFVNNSYIVDTMKSLVHVLNFHFLPPFLVSFIAFMVAEL